MWIFDWGVFWSVFAALLAAFAVRGMWGVSWDQLLGTWTPTLWGRLDSAVRQLVSANEKLAAIQKSLESPRKP
jgi:hypothetical protein